MRRISRGLVVRVVAALAAIGLVAGVLDAVLSSNPEMTITARFLTAPGLYAGNQVRILGMPVGTVTKVTPGPEYVTVVMQVPQGTNIPADARAEIMAPQVVNDRYVQLDPAWTGGPTMQSGAVIPLARTQVAISVDDIINSLDALAKALGPNGTNADGALSSFLASAAKAFGPNGAPLHSTLESLGQALGALSDKSPQLTALFDNLGNLSSVASHYTTTYQSFANDLAAVSTELAGDNQNLAGALANLQQALGQLAEFIRTNGAALGASVRNLSTFAGAVASRQKELAAALTDLPVALDNLLNAYDPNAPGGPALRTRLDPQGNSAGFSKSVCGDPLLRLLLISVDQPQDKIPTVDLACGVNGVLSILPLPPNASSGPDLSVAALVGGHQ